MEPDQLVYQFRQRIERYEKPSEDAAPVTESYDRTGVLLLASTRSLANWNRSLCEYLGTAGELADWRRRPAVPRAEMLETHVRHLGERKLPGGSRRPLELASDGTNADLVGLSDQLNAWDVGLPTVLPVFTDLKPEVGHVFPGKIAFNFGDAIFQLPHRTEVKEIRGTRAVLHVEFETKQSWVQRRGVVLLLRPTGTIDLTIDLRDFLPREQEGSFKLACFTRYQRDGKPLEFDVASVACTFATKQVPAAFDAENFRAVGWTEDVFAPKPTA